MGWGGVGVGWGGVGVGWGGVGWGYDGFSEGPESSPDGVASDVRKLSTFLPGFVSEQSFVCLSPIKPALGPHG